MIRCGLVAAFPLLTVCERVYVRAYYGGRPSSRQPQDVPHSSSSDYFPAMLRRVPRDRTTQRSPACLRYFPTDLVSMYRPMIESYGLGRGDAQRGQVLRASQASDTPLETGTLSLRPS